MKLRVWLLIGAVISLVLMATFYQIVTKGQGIGTLLKDIQAPPSREKFSSVRGDVVVREVRPATNFVGARVERGDLEEGCDTGKDCIPSIDAPVIAKASEVDWLSLNDLVIGLVIRGEARAYPVSIMTTYELVNDVIQDRPVLITYCSLCGSYYAFDPVVDGVHTQFGASGHLQHSCMIMYDRYEGSLWQQMTGDAVVGEAARRDETLRRISLTVTTWARWRSNYPDTGVMLPPLGEREAIGARYQRFADYESSSLFFVPAERAFQETRRYLPAVSLSQTLAPKDTVYGIILPDGAAAFGENDLSEGRTITASIGPTTVNMIWDDTTGMPIATIVETDEEIPVQRSMWFAWEAYFPDTVLIEE